MKHIADCIKKTKQQFFSKKLASNNKAVSELIGTVLLLAITIATFTTLVLLSSSYFSNTPSPSVNLIAYLDGENIIIEHHGGESLSTDTSLIYTIGGQNIQIPLQGLDDENSNNQWDLGEKVSYHSSTINSSVQIRVSVIDTPSNTALFSGTLQDGLTTTADVDISTIVNTINPYQQTSTPLTITASADSRLDSVALYYRYSQDNQSWGQTGASNWWDSDWTYMREITIDSTYIESDLEDFPILLKLNSAIASKCDDGDSIRFVNYQNTESYPYQIELWDNNGDSYIWVSIDSISSTEDTIIRFYYNNSQATDNQNPQEVWDRDYEAVWHFGETGTGIRYDSTDNNNDCTPQNYDGDESSLGKIAGADAFGGNQEWLLSTDINSIEGESKLTYETWINYATLTNLSTLFAKKLDDTNTIQFGLADNGDNDDVLLQIGNTILGSAYTSSDLIQTNQWYHYCVVYDGDQTVNTNRLKLYLNGQQQSLSYIGDIPSTTDINNALVSIGSNSYDQSIIYYDNFDDGDISDWATTVPSSSGAGTYTYNSSLYSMYTRWSAVTVSSPTINMDSYTEATLSLWIQRGDDSFSENPETNEDLTLQYYTDAGQWQTLATYSGSGTAGQIYQPSFTLPANALHSNFQLRFIQNTGSGSDYDYWHIDDIKIIGLSPSYLQGTVDEMRLSKTARSQAWITASYHNQDNPESFASVGSEQQQSISTDWTLYNTDTQSPWQYTFNFPQGIGYYQFHSIGSYNSLTESSPTNADARCFYSQSQATGPIAQWSMDENTGTTASDSIGNNDGTITGATWTTGISGSALSFDGTNDYIEIDDSATLDLSQSLSFEAWINPAGDGLAPGEMAGSIIDTSIFGDDGSEWAKINFIGNNIYAIVYEDWNDDGWIKTVQIQNDGTISNSEIDSLEFDNSNGKEPDLVHVSGDIYAITYKGNQNDGYVTTVEINSDGTIENSIIDSLEFDNTDCNYPEIIQVAGAVFAIAYESNGNQGYITTVEINTDGNIENSVIDSYRFDSNGEEPSIIKISSDVYAIAYVGGGSDGFLTTVEIASDGSISTTPLDTLEFDTTDCTFPDIIHVADDVYAIAYVHDWWTGHVTTLQVTDTGDISNAVIDTYQYESSTAMYCDIEHVNRDIYAIAYLGSGDDGFIKTIQIQPDGTITNTILDSFEYETQTGYYPSLLQINEGTFAAAYTNQPWKGALKTFTINGQRGLYKSNSYGLDFDASTAYCFINDNTLFGPINSGWNHIVLTYDLAETQQKLFINGNLVQTHSIDSSISQTNNPLLIGFNVEGVIDEVILYSDALSLQEIQDRYTLYTS